MRVKTCTHNKDEWHTYVHCGMIGLLPECHRTSLEIAGGRGGEGEVEREKEVRRGRGRERRESESKT